MNVIILSDGETTTTPASSVKEALRVIEESDLVRAGDFDLISIVKGEDE